MYEIRKHVSLSKNPKARITLKISHKMCSMNSLASAKGLQKFKREPIKI